MRRLQNISVQHQRTQHTGVNAYCTVKEMDTSLKFVDHHLIPLKLEVMSSWQTRTMQIDWKVTRYWNDSPYLKHTLLYRLFCSKQDHNLYKIHWLFKRKDLTVKTEIIKSNSRPTWPPQLTTELPQTWNHKEREWTKRTLQNNNSVFIILCFFHFLNILQVKLTSAVS